ncbi:MAG: dihydropteroate synthase [Alphaproteobacteria bacterium]
MGILWGLAAAEGIREGQALPLAGGPAAFSAIEIIEGAPGSTTRKIALARDIAASSETSIRETLARITAPRKAFAGVAMDRPQIMGIVNVTPDSFSDGGDFSAPEAAETHARQLAAEGAAFVDIGGESTRPGAAEVDEQEELRRVCPVIERLAEAGLSAAISIDTRKSAVMEAAVARGSTIINDVSALSHDPHALALAAKSGASVVLMHAKGDPRTMQDHPVYTDVTLEVYDYLEARIDAAVAAGIPRERLAADPGIGFGKTLDHNLALLGSLSMLHGLGVPVLLGASRKRIIGSITGKRDPKERLAGSLGVAIAGASAGAQIVRVHDVDETTQALDVWRASVTGHGIN